MDYEREKKEKSFKNKTCVPANKPGGELTFFCVQMFSVKTSDGVVATSFKKDDKVKLP
jgi:hypothetical protein